MSKQYKVKRADRAAIPLQVGQIVYESGYDSYGLKNDDTRLTGIEYESFSVNESGKPVFTMPLEDVIAMSKTSTERHEYHCDGRDFCVEPAAEKLAKENHG